MRLTQPFLRTLFLCLLAAPLVACGSSHGGIDASSDSALPDASEDTGTGTDATPGDGGTDAGPPECPADIFAVEGMACPVEGQACGECPADPCSFCNQMICTSGLWTRLEAFPASCHDCGDADQCTSFDEYCEHTLSDTEDPDSYRCAPLPEECTGDVTCGCLETSLSNGACTGDGTTGLTLQVGGA